ncbi:uncharacterized protein [Rutidosis leptorrhynchoides]|uniref:uncharacterized protein n=1 Tax=Rutidosis leptorrhynchoides TaxID=125765 RepID=UPI003A998AF7
MYSLEFMKNFFISMLYLTAVMVSLSLKELVSGHESTEQTQTSIINLPLAHGNGEDEPSGLKVGLQKVKIFKAKKTCRDEEGSDEKSVKSYDADYPFDTDSLDEVTDLNLRWSSFNFFS